MKKFFTKLKKTRRNYYSIIMGTAIVFYWRGVWSLMDMYFFPDQPLLSYGLSAGIGIFLLFINDFRLRELEH